MFQGIEFISPHKHINDSNGVNEPAVYICYVVSSSLKKAKQFLRDEKVVTISCSDRVGVEIARMFNSCLSKSGLIDFTSGLTVKEGFLLPLPSENRQVKNVERSSESKVLERRSRPHYFLFLPMILIGILCIINFDKIPEDIFYKAREKVQHLNAIIFEINNWLIELYTVGWSASQS